MFGSQILEVVVGLVLIYLVLSVGCSGIKEVISAVFSMRAKTLEEGIRSMLQGQGGDLTAELFKHPLIASLARAGDRPSYIASRTFSLALLDILAPADGAQPRTLQELRAGVARLQQADLRRTLLTLIDASQGDLDAARGKIEGWFNDTMDRVSGWYKRKAQAIIFVAGLILCGCVNADTLMVVKELWNDEAMRHAVVAAAEKKVQQGAPAESSSSNTSLGPAMEEIRGTSVPPIGWSSRCGDTRGLPVEFGGWLLKILGILLSSFAIVLGAPFWFDVLNNLLKLNARASGSKPA
jgi:hypothetical protein